MNAYAERLARESLAGIPPGCYRFTDYLDDDGQGLELFTLADPELLDLQQAYVRKVVDTVNAALQDAGFAATASDDSTDRLSTAPIPSMPSNASVRAF